MRWFGLRARRDHRPADLRSVPGVVSWPVEGAPPDLLPVERVVTCEKVFDLLNLHPHASSGPPSWSARASRSGLGDDAGGAPISDRTGCGT